MSDFELLQQKVSVMTRRLDLLEAAGQARLASDADDLAAQRVAESMGFTARLVVVGKKFRVEVARKLKGEGWSSTRIARVLEVTDRTVERWTCPRSKMWKK